MSLLYAEHGIEDFYCDPSTFSFAQTVCPRLILQRQADNVEKLEQEAKDSGLYNRVHAQKNHQEMCDSLKSGQGPKLFVFSIPHGGPGDAVLKVL